MTLFLHRFLLSAVFLLGSTFSLNADWVQPPEQFTFNMQAYAYGGASDNNGNAITAWSNNGTNVVGASYYNGVTNTWGPSVIIGNATSSLDGLAVSMDATGAGLVLWEEESSGQIKSAHFSGGVWTTPTPNPVDTINVMNTNLDVSLNGNGLGAGIWIDGPTSEVRSAFYNPGTNSWAPATVIGTGTNYPTIAYSLSGTAIATWLNGISVIASYFNGTFWTAPITLGSSFISVVSEINAFGTTTIAWVDSATGNILIVTTSDGVSFTPSTPNPVATGAGNTGLSLAVAPTGMAVLTWIDGLANGQVIRFNGVSWSAPMQYATGIEIPLSSNQTASVSSNGDALLVYGTSDGKIFSVYLPLNGVLGPTLLVTDQVDTLGSNVLRLISAISSGGRGFAFWYPNTEGPNVFASVLLPTVAPPSGLAATTCKNRFATQTDIVNIITWTPSPDPFVSVYYLKRNGVLIAVIPATGPFTFLDHNRCKGSDDIYTLTAVNEFGLESTPVVVIVRQ